MADTVQYDTYFKENRERHLQELQAFLSIPSISSLPSHQADMERAAKWLTTELMAAGMENAIVLQTAGHPVVYAEWLNAPDKPTVLIYGHYDVQPVDPLALWDTPPFEPTIRDEKLYARGATDDKGQLFMHIKAIEALMACRGELPVNIKVCFEGEEEIASPHFEAFVAENQDLLAADVVVISDTPLWEAGQPAIYYGLKGLCGLQIDLRGQKEDLHSGFFGGLVHNPLHAMAQLLASLVAEDGRIAIEGFYDDVKSLSEEEKTAFARIPYDAEATRESLGVESLFGEPEYSALERNWARPTLDINGMWGGFQGEGTKTVIPAEAHAKITCRLVDGQVPERILEKIEQHLQKHKPAGMTVSTSWLPGKASPYSTPVSHPAIQAAARAYIATYGAEPLYTRVGGTIPAVEVFHRLMHLPIVLMGFGMPDENYHAPNEHFYLVNFDTGLRTICCFLDEIAGLTSING
ncbi:dipeptidase [Brevibacillus fluminis]|uniref:Dipeptidase n=1 Tax=Brevibacillus fluminis TaxID=511487 RepID=A0A3M8DBG9_9BACL|nr:dipeptidase [Brevibacillus fluminis]RNB84617.1 dipeptidase [Brevibacillus fluminis]